MATKSRRPVVMSTPPPTKSRSMYTPAEKESLLENFDLEVVDKTRAFRSALAATLSSFLLRQETEILRIPRELRGMTLGELEGKWGGNWAGTLRRVAKDRIEEREAKAEAEAKEMEIQAGKRKRNTVTTLDPSPVRTSKNARREPLTTKANGPATGTTKGRKAPSKRSKASTSTADYPPSITTSTLPQNHVFNPSLPPTPGFPRQPRQHESLLSANGSPLLNPYTQESGQTPSEADSDYDLPDPEALERELLAKQASQTPARPSAPSRKKRAPSLMFRQSLSATTPFPLIQHGGLTGTDEPQLSSIPLSDGRTLSFNPLHLSPGRIDAEMDEGGLGASEREKVKVKVKEEVVRVLTEQMARWQVMS